MRASAQTVNEYRFSELSERSEQDIRQSLARELHDELGPSVSVIRYSTEILVAEEVEGAVMTSLHREVLALQENLRRILGDLRGEQPVHSRIFDTLISARVSLREAGIVDDFSCHSSFDLSPVLEHEFSQIAKEAIHNCLQHADAKKISVIWSCDDTCVVLKIVDDGNGFLPSVYSPDSFGIQGMAERSKKIGANFSITSTPNKGTVVSCTLNGK